MSIGMIRKRQREQQIIEEIIEESYKCPFCDKEYKTKKGLDNHIETKHERGE